MNTLHTSSIPWHNHRVRLVSDSTISHFLTPQKIKIHLVLSYLNLLTAGTSHQTYPSLLELIPPYRPFPLVFFLLFSLLLHSPLHGQVALSPILPGGFAWIQPTSFVLSLFTAREKSHFPRMGYINLRPTTKWKFQGPFLNNDYTFQDGTGRVWVSSRGLWQLCRDCMLLKLVLCSTLELGVRSVSQALYFQPRPLSWALGLNTTLYDDHSLFDHQSPPGRFCLLLTVSLTSCVMLGKTLTLWTAVFSVKSVSMWKLVQVSRW